MSTNPKSFKNLLDEFSGSIGITEKIYENKLFEVWEEIVGIPMAKSAKIKKIENGIVHIRTKSSTWHVELTLRKDLIIKKLNEELGKNFVKDLIIK